MKKSLSAVMMAALLVSGLSVAQAADKTAQQQKMVQCNQHATTQNLKGDAHKSFISECLKREQNGQHDAAAGKNETLQ
ncbi:Phosphate starvation-inducible protein PsiF precursor|nr:Phosphate starvation-inducible protein PsiF precursor [Candidatus Pantoea persica]